MNAITSFRLCTLSDEELIRKVDEKTDALYKDKSGLERISILTRHIPARPNDDYDLLIGELILRFAERTTLPPLQQ